VVAGGEHGADGAEDYDGEDGDDDAVWLVVLVRLSLVFRPSLSLFSLFQGCDVPCPCVEGGNDGLHGCWLCCLIGRWDGLRGLAWAGRWLLVVREGGVGVIEVLLRRIEV
jgi:hypothetical protein